MNRWAIYARVSTAAQTTDPQIRDLEAYCERRGWHIVDRYVDTEHGDVIGRRELHRLLEDSRRRHFDGVLVWKFDRFSRSLVHLIRSLELFHSIGIEFVSLHEAIDTTTPTGRLMFQILGAFGEFEREVIRARVRAGLAAARARGKRLGRPMVGADPRHVEELRRRGLSFRAIAAQLGVSRGTLLNRLRTPRPLNC